MRTGHSAPHTYLASQRNKTNGGQIHLHVRGTVPLRCIFYIAVQVVKPIAGQQTLYENTVCSFSASFATFAAWFAVYRCGICLIFGQAMYFESVAEALANALKWALLPKA